MPGDAKTARRATSSRRRRCRLRRAVDSIPAESILLSLRELSSRRERVQHDVRRSLFPAGKKCTETSIPDNRSSPQSSLAPPNPRLPLPLRRTRLLLIARAILVRPINTRNKAPLTPPRVLTLAEALARWSTRCHRRPRRAAGEDLVLELGERRKARGATTSTDVTGDAQHRCGDGDAGGAAVGEGCAGR